MTEEYLTELRREININKTKKYISSRQLVIIDNKTFMEITKTPKESFGRKVKRLTCLAFMIFGGVIILVIIIAVSTGDSWSTKNNTVIQQPATKNFQAATESKSVTSVHIIKKTETNTAPASAKTEIKTIPMTTQAPTLTPQTDRVSMLVILKANASTKWGANYQMVKYEYDNQVESYDWVVAQTKYPNIMIEAKQKWGNNYQMVQYEYNNQVEAYEWIVIQTAHPEIMAKAKVKWGTNYQMVK